MKSAIVVLLTASCLFTTKLQAQTTIHVDGGCGDDSWSGASPLCQAPVGPKRTIQAGMNAAQPGDTVLVADGTYTGPGNKGLSFSGEAFTVRSANGPQNCVIDAQGSGNGFWFVADETPASIVIGFTVTNGNLSTGGAVFCHHSSSPTLVNCVLTGNTASAGGAISCDTTSSPTLIGCTLTGNMAGSGGGAYFESQGASGPTLINCTIAGNTASFDGGGVFTASPRSTILNCTITGNTAAGRGGAIHVERGSPVITNCILWDNSPEEISVEPLGSPDVTYCDVQDGWPGIGNVTADPLFLDPSSGNHRLSAASPAIDAGNNDAVLPAMGIDSDGNPRLVDDPGMPDTGNGTSPLVDLGAFEFQGTTTTFVLVRPMPGVAGQENAFQVAGAPAGARVLVVGGRRPGSTNVPGCPGLTVAIANPTLVGSTVTDANGAGTIRRFVPAAARGLSVRLQALVRSTCQVSNLVTHELR